MNAGIDPLADRRSTRRWLLSFVLVAGLHIGAGAGALLWEPDVERAGRPAAALLVELAPVLAASETDLQELPPGPAQVESQAAPPHAGPELDEPLQEMPVVEHATAVLPPTLEHPQPEFEPEPRAEPVPAEDESRSEPPARTTSAPPAFEAPASPERATPVEAVPSTLPDTARLTWQTALLGHLNRHKRYPLAARRRSDEGVARVWFTMDRNGRVLSRRLEQSTGSRALDAEAVALLDRAEPLPALPREIVGEAIELVVPVEFFIN